MTDDIKKLIEEARTYPMPQAALKTEIACARFVVRLCDALEAEHERAEEASEVLAGADHTAAKYWRRMKGAELARGQLRALLAEIRAGMSEAPECDVYPDGSTITCGWKSDMIRVRRILSRAIDTKEKP